MKLFPALILLAAAVLPYGCISDHTERVADVNPLGWMPGDTVWVEHINRDTVSLSNLSVLVRQTTGNDPELLGITVCTITPDPVFYQEPVTLNTAATGIIRNDHRESVIPYRHSVILQRPGTYRFGFVPHAEYRGITAIGIKLE